MNEISLKTDRYSFLFICILLSCFNKN